MVMTFIANRSIHHDAPALGYELSKSRDDPVTHAGRNENVTLPTVSGALKSTGNETEGAFHLRA
jgi:hypothetical protein